MQIKANAKINLSLNVIKRRDDGYHELAMIMMPIQLFDTIIIKESTKEHFTCNDETLKLDESNTLIKTVRLMKKTFNYKNNFHIQLIKKIPSMAGLAGGSADAAALMKAINKSLHLQLSKTQLAELGLQIGADVPFCIMNTTALVSGIGEIVQPFENQCHFHLLLVKPHEGVSTKAAFAQLDLTRCAHPDTQTIYEAMKVGDYQTFIKHLDNSLEYSAAILVDQILYLKSMLLDMGFDTAKMSGSGSCVFAVTKDENLLKKAYQTLKNQQYFVHAETC